MDSKAWTLKTHGLNQRHKHQGTDSKARTQRRGFKGTNAKAQTQNQQHRAFSIVGPSVWNSLPSEIRFLPRDLSSSFCKLLKTFIFARAWAGSASEYLS